MDATTVSMISSCHLPLPSALHLHRRKIPRGRGGGSSAGVKTWSRSGRNVGRSRVNSLFGDGGGGDGFRAVKRIVKLNSAIQNRSVKELLELVGDECQYFFTNLLPSIDVSNMSKILLLLHEMMVKHHVSFVLKPSKDEGFDLGIKWSLGLFRAKRVLIEELQERITELCLPAEWKGKKLPWDLDCNVSTDHVYRGMLLISQVNKTFVPLLRMVLQIIHQNLDAVITTVANKVLPEGVLRVETTISQVNYFTSTV
ncbi:hypothetical protein GUJ93_ZPchr0008g13675 [Zizania palustris]|uniref:Uncharacterized protein n=1 Tax=Zizania palustris TaxID=103762 RepID=A0A8J5VHN2_ZIZPA|nr:hypothetical protein GUJ93_ZPchr0008g13675 [Zizania palustris]